MRRLLFMADEDSIGVWAMHAIRQDLKSMKRA